MGILQLPVPLLVLCTQTAIKAVIAAVLTKNQKLWVLRVEERQWWKLGGLFLLYFCICQGILVLDDEDSEEEMLQDIGEGLNVSIDCG